MPRFTSVILSVLSAAALLATSTTSFADASIVVNCTPADGPNDKCTVNDLANLREKILKMSKTCASEGSAHKFDDTDLSGEPHWVKSAFPIGTRRSLADAKTGLRGGDAPKTEALKINPEVAARFEEAMGPQGQRKLQQVCPTWVWPMCLTTDPNTQFTCCAYLGAVCVYCAGYEPGRRMLGGEEETVFEAEAPVESIVTYMPNMADACTQQFQEIIKTNTDCLGPPEEAKCHIMDIITA